MNAMLYFLSAEFEQMEQKHFKIHIDLRFTKRKVYVSDLVANICCSLKQQREPYLSKRYRPCTKALGTACTIEHNQSEGVFTCTANVITGLRSVLFHAGVCVHISA